MIDTLYITDLDGMLLRNDQRISARSASILNQLIDNGAAISVASARSLIGIHMVNLSDVRFHIPMILMNGVLLYDFAAGRVLDSCSWNGATTAQVLEISAAGGKTPFLYRVTDGKLDISFTQMTSEGERIFYRDRAAVFPKSFRQVEQYSTEDVVYCTMQDRYEVLLPIRERLQLLPDVACVLYTDTYREGNWYLEIYSAAGGKGNGVTRLRKRLEAQRVVAFGDNLNDLSMLEVADVSCVVANGSKEVRDVADIVIGSNEDDGVAQFILQDITSRKGRAER